MSYSLNLPRLVKRIDTISIPPLPLLQPTLLLLIWMTPTIGVLDATLVLKERR